MPMITDLEPGVWHTLATRSDGDTALLRLQTLPGRWTLTLRERTFAPDGAVQAIAVTKLEEHVTLDAVIR